MAFERRWIIIGIVIALLVLAGIAIPLIFIFKGGGDDPDQETDDSILDDLEGSPVIIHMILLVSETEFVDTPAFVDQISELSIADSETDGINIITISKNNGIKIPSGRKYLEDGWDVDVSWPWIDDPEMDSIPEECLSYYADLINHGDQTLIFLNRNHNISSIHRLNFSDNTSNVDILSHQQIMNKFESFLSNNPDSDWMGDYSPSFGIGSLEHDWWTTYPDQNPLSGSSPIHPTWIVDMLHNGSILIFGHSMGCMPCVEQEGSVKKVETKYGENIQILDLQSGVDERANEIMKIYDPNGSPNYVPSTILLSLVKTDESDVRIVWHSAEGATGDDWLNGYVKDAIFYHEMNVQDWEG